MNATNKLKVSLNQFSRNFQTSPRQKNGLARSSSSLPLTLLLLLHHRRNSHLAPPSLHQLNQYRKHRPLFPRAKRTRHRPVRRSHQHQFIMRRRHRVRMRATGRMCIRMVLVGVIRTGRWERVLRRELVWGYGGVPMMIGMSTSPSSRYPLPR